MNETESAIAYFEDAIRESDEIIGECTPNLQAELKEQKRHFEVALAALHIKQAKEGKYYQCENCNFWSEGDPRCMCEDSQWAGCTVKKDNYCGHFQPQVEHIQTET